MPWAKKGVKNFSLLMTIGIAVKPDIAKSPLISIKSVLQQSIFEGASRKKKDDAIGNVRFRKKRESKQWHFNPDHVQITV